MATLDIAVTIDSYMNLVAPNTNNDTFLVGLGGRYVGSAKYQLNRPIMNFDVSALAGKTINAAELRLDVEISQNPATGGESRRGRWGGATTCTIYRCTRPTTWTEAGVTWNKYNGVSNWTSAGGDFDRTTPAPAGFEMALATGMQVIPGLKGFVEDALANRGNVLSVIVKADDEAPGETHDEWFASRTHGTLTPPTIRVDYT